MKSFEDLLGISSKEAEIFILLNASGAMPVSSLATRLQRNRTTVFSAVRRLVEKGLLYEIPSPKGALFAAIDPDDLLKKSQERLKQEQQNMILCRNMVKSLQQEKGNKIAKPQVSFFEGEEGIIALFRQTLSWHKKQKAFLTLEHIPDRIRQYLMTEYIVEKKKRGITSQVLIPRSDRALHYQSLDIEGNRETRFVPQKTPFETEIILEKDRLALFDFQGSVGVCMESESLAHTFESMFDLLWKGADFS